MSTTRTINGGWYSHVLTTGEFASLVADGIETHLGKIPQPVNDAGQPDGPLFLDITAVGGFHLAGKGANSFITHERVPDGTWVRHPDACGNYSVMYDLAGVLHISDCSIGTQGWRSIAPDGTLVTGDHSILLDGINEFTDLGDDILIGQGNATGGVVVRIDGIKRQLAAGACYDIKARRSGDTVAISFYDVAPDGLSAHLWWGSLDDLRALALAPPPPPPPPPPPVLQPPAITVLGYGHTLRSGDPWEVSFLANGTRFIVRKDGLDRLWISAQNDAGSDHTGNVRQLTVEGPTPPEPPPMPTLERFWYQPNVGSRDLLAVDIASLAHVQVVVLPVQCVLTDEPGGQVGDNTYPNLAAAGFFRKLKESGIALVIEAGALKEFDCTGAFSRAQIQTAVDRVTAAGGAIAAFSMDEPLTGNTIPNAQGRACDLPLPVCVDVMVAYIQQVHALGILCGWLEAFPRIPFDQLKECLRLLNARGALPDYMHADIEWPATTDTKAATFTHAMQQECAKYGVTYGAFINSQKDPCATDQVHDSALMQLAPKIHTIVPDVAHVHVASWVRRVKDGPQDVPNNLGPFGLIDTFEKVRTLFQPTIPVDQPPPVETFLMDYKLVDYVIGIKALKPSAAGGRVTAILPDDRVASMQPDGSFGTRDAGMDAAYEQAIERDKLLLYEPIPGKRYAAGYRVVA